MKHFENCVKTILLRRLSNIVKSPFSDIEIPNDNLPEYIIERIKKFSSKVAIECSITKRKYTYGDVISKSRNLNRALRKHVNLRNNEYVALILPNVPEFPIAVLGILLANLKVTLLGSGCTLNSIESKLKYSNAKAIITLTELLPLIRKAKKITSQIPIIAINDMPSTDKAFDTISFNSMVDDHVDFPDVQIDNESVAVLSYSSRTCGVIKGVMLTHRNIIANLQQLQHPDLYILQHASDTFQETIAAVIPMSHMYGFTGLQFGGMLAGCKLITLPKFTPELYLHVLKAYKITILSVVPPIIIFLHSSPSVKKKHLSNVKAVISFSDYLGDLDEEKLRTKIKHPIILVQGFGMTEASPFISLRSYKKANKAGSIGSPLPNTSIKIIPPDDLLHKGLGPNKAGEMFVKGPQIMLGYHQNEFETANVLFDGWLRTGDLVYYDNDIDLYVDDRIEEIILVEGKQVYSSELEELLRSHPSVLEAAVIGIPHAILGEVPRAYVVKKQLVNKNDLLEYVSSKVQNHKTLRGGIEFVQCIPKTVSGKVKRKALKYEKNQFEL